MKVLVVLSALVAFAAAAPLTKREQKILETFDYDALFANDKERNILFDCIEHKGDCGDYKELVDLSTRAMASNCAECNPTLKKIYERIRKMLQDKYEHIYKAGMKNAAALKE